MRPIKSPFFETKTGRVTSQEEINKTLELYVAEGILKKMIIDGEPAYMNSDKLTAMSKEEQLEWIMRFQEGKDLLF